MNKELKILAAALIASSVCISACAGAKKETETATSETSVVITTPAETAESCQTEATTAYVPDGGTQRRRYPPGTGPQYYSQKRKDPDSRLPEIQ